MMPGEATILFTKNSRTFINNVMLSSGMELTSLDIHYVVQELSSLTGAKVEKIFQSTGQEKRDLFFTLYVKDAEKRHLRLLLPGVLCSPKEKGQYPTQPPGFAMFLRKYLSGIRLQSAEQLGFDRIIVITLASKITTYKLMIELLTPGNVLLLDDKEIIINLLENQQYKDRQLRPRQSYVPPPPSYDVLHVTDEELYERIMTSTKESIVKTLAIHCTLGGTYAEEVCARARIDKHRNDLKKDEVITIVQTIRSLCTLPIAAHIDETQRVYPFKLITKTTTPCEQTSFLAAIAQALPPEKHTEEKKETKEKPKLQTIMDAQRQQVTKFENDIGTEQRKGELIYEHYALVQEILASIREARAKKQNIPLALKKFKEFSSYNESNGEVTLEIGQ